MNKTIYKPNIFDIDNIQEAKNIILTPEAGLKTQDRWEVETPFIVDSIIENLNINEKSLVLDFGCGIGRVSKKLIEKTNCKIIGADISSSMRKLAKEYVNSDNFKIFSPKELEQLIQNGLRVDAAISIWVLQHCLNPMDEINLIKSALKKDALIYILNNNTSAVPTNKGWINNNINVQELLNFKFEEVKKDILPEEFSHEKISKNTFISILKNSKGFKKVSKNKEVLILLKNAIEEYNKKSIDKAKEIYLKVLEIEEDNEEALGNLGVILKAQKDYEKAISYYIKAIKINPDNSLTYNNLGNTFKEIKDYKRAVLAFTDCIKRDSTNFSAFNNLGIVYESMGDNERAIKCYKEAVRINPKFSKAVNNIGVVLYKQKKYQQSIDIFRIAFKIDPEYYELHSNIGACFNKLKKYDEAIKSLDLAIKHNPKNGGAYTNLGNVYNKLFDYKKAAKLHEKSIALEPKGSNAYSNVGTSYKYLGLTNKAIKAYQKAIQLDPSFVNAHFDLATMYLSIGDFLNGFKEYEYRFQKEEMKSHIISNKDIFLKPMLRHDMNIKGKTLLLHSEQGFGDSIQFIRFVEQIKEKFQCTIAVKCRDELKELFRLIPQIDILTNRKEKTPEFDFHLPIMSMPYVLGIKTVKDIPNNIPYLFSKEDQELKLLKEENKINIGICWSASITGESYDGKVFDLKFLDKLINSENINVYTLQVGPENEDIKKYNYEDKIIDLTSKLTDFSKTASLLNELDLVISSDTSVAHLAGALNVPVWIPLQKVPDWRWQNKGNKSPWYPSAKLFRQKTARVWDGVFQSICDNIYQNFKIKI
ncbi:MAG: tetratricopeptide repeat protein [Poseidonibacter sp.]|uniref:tetratricopeptide repeat protein n=1 Tax=Poseidonibacter sp. TaxID=2321188 RepID=UPI00359CF385